MNSYEALVPVVMFLVLGLVILGYFYWNHRNRETVMQTVQKAIDSGQEMTAETLSRLGAAVNPRMRDLRRGIVFLSLGIAGLLCSLFFDLDDVVNGIRAASVFPLMLGLGFLLVWKLNKD
ncbi:MAG: hypothetical protein HKO85_01830 [Xanthomonadales bacterium]|nr:hypothetical protein [Gammaproteobacteria bacterium]MBT8050165.1 hypothetical protein [Gammaproteobacteria bacterium]NNJ78404.1 hypothetical protein [Xanthomonadales bacterium]NNL03999.1 hypothetical protein [Xanthomonadales bacterium]